MALSTVQVSVPATTANLGPGFDCLGAAWTLHNQFRFTQLDPGEALQISAKGEGAADLTTDETNFVYRSFRQLFDHLQQPVPPVRIEIDASIPLARGLGSSATAIVGGLVGANALAGEPLSLEAIGDLATQIEGHPDNVIPALLGGCRLAASGIDRAWEICELPWHGEIVPVFAIPAFSLSTERARSVLPAHYSRADAVFNAAHLGLLIRALDSGNGDWLRAALQDRIHEPYRSALIPGRALVEAAAIAAGAHGLVISGAGPTLVALATAERAEAIAQAMVSAWHGCGIEAKAHVLAIETAGTVIRWL
jgi:homoserine kinase